jgi:hypothetical protein
MIDLKQQHQDLIDEDITSIDSEVAYNQIKSRLKYDEYTYPAPSELTFHTDNPGVEHHYNFLEWGPGWKPVDQTDLIQSYPEYLPTVELITELQKFDSLIEIGSGNGYWAYVLDAFDIDIVASDKYPIDVQATNTEQFAKYTGYFSGDYSRTPGQTPFSVVYDTDDSIRLSSVWTRPVIADHTIVEDYKDSAVLLCHPPTELWVEDLLQRLAENNQTLVYVGDWYPGCDATPKFFKTLLDSWSLEKVFPVYRWERSSASAYIFS